MILVAFRYLLRSLRQLLHSIGFLADILDDLLGIKAGVMGEKKTSWSPSAYASPVARPGQTPERLASVVPEQGSGGLWEQPLAAMPRLGECSWREAMSDARVSPANCATKAKALDSAL
jgi:hypothetical protein